MPTSCRKVVILPPAAPAEPQSAPGTQSLFLPIRAAVSGRWQSAVAKFADSNRTQTDRPNPQQSGDTPENCYTVLPITPAQDQTGGSPSAVRRVLSRLYRKPSVCSVAPPSFRCCCHCCAGIPPASTPMKRKNRLFSSPCIRPLLIDRCYQCHLAPMKHRSAAAGPAQRLGSGGQGPAIAPGNPADSLPIRGCQRQRSGT
jgi:hypothetical protein